MAKGADYNFVVLGGGSAGLVAAYMGAALKAKVALIEKHRMGGDCLNTGCVPSKTLLKSAKIYSLRHRAADFGLKNIHTEMQFSEVMAHVQKVIQKIAPNDSVERYQSLGVSCFSGEGKILSRHEVGTGSKLLRTKNIIVATRAAPFVPKIEGLAQVDFLTSDSVWSLESLPSKLLVMGGGAIGCELAQAFARLGSRVVLMERNDRLLPREDPEVGQVLKDKFEKEGIQVVLGKHAQQFQKIEGVNSLLCADGSVIEFDKVLLALGRRANTKGFGLEERGVDLNEAGFIEVDDKMRTSSRGIFACGDVVGKMQFTHFASLSGSTAAINSLFWPFQRKVDLRVFPWVTFTDPEVARVGLSEIEALKNGVNYQVNRFSLSHSDRALTEGECEGFLKVITKSGSDEILGATLVGVNAGEVLQEITFAMTHGLGLNAILSTIHAYPTWSEVNRALAGAWKREGVSGGTNRILEIFQRFRRSF